MIKASKRMWLLGLLLVLFPTAYFVAQFYEFPIHYLYAAVGGVLGIAYLVYNKGFSGKGVTPEMLPDSMSLEEKKAFIEDSRRRLENSRWMLMILIPILLTFAADMVYLFIFPMIEGLFA